MSEGPMVRSNGDRTMAHDVVQWAKDGDLSAHNGDRSRMAYKGLTAANVALIIAVILISLAHRGG